MMIYDDAILADVELHVAVLGPSLCFGLSPILCQNPLHLTATHTELYVEIRKPPGFFLG
jgi:hypothetical protein